MPFLSRYNFFTYDLEYWSSQVCCFRDFLEGSVEWLIQLDFCNDIDSRGAWERKENQHVVHKPFFFSPSKFQGCFPENHKNIYCFLFVDIVWILLVLSGPVIAQAKAWKVESGQWRSQNTHGNRWNTKHTDVKRYLKWILH